MLFYSADIFIMMGETKNRNKAYESIGCCFCNFANYVTHSSLNFGPKEEMRVLLFISVMLGFKNASEQ